MSHLRNRGPLLLVVIIILALVGTLVGANRAIPDDNLAYPVLITLKNGSTGSGFFVNTGRAVYLAGGPFKPDFGLSGAVLPLDIVSLPLFRVFVCRLFRLVLHCPPQPVG
jgi:hypothetical protein